MKEKEGVARMRVGGGVGVKVCIRLRVDMA